MKTEKDNSTKIFVIGLPRTGTTSLCAAFLELGYTTAHTAYTQKTFEEAQVIADTPIFSEYPLLDKAYPESKYIYLTRSLDQWVPSIKQLLNRMHTNLTRCDGGFNPYIKQSYKNTFHPFNIDTINNECFLAEQYHKHQQSVYSYFEKREHDLLTIDISEQESFSKLLTFLKHNKSNKGNQFPKLNIGGKVTAWKDIKHTSKIESTHRGRIDSIKCLNNI